MIEQQINVLSWNVRGLNCPDRRAAVHETVAASSCQMVCLQETKLENVDMFTASFLGGHRLRNFVQRPSIGTRGGILMLWDDDHVAVTDVVITTFYLSATIHIKHSDVSYRITVVYGPTSSSLKEDFFTELISHKPPCGELWLALGDFNQIYRSRDKNKRNVSRRQITRFRTTLQSCHLKEIHLQNRRFTWSNERSNPTLCKLDSFFCNAEWDIQFGTHILHALSSSLSDHCPLLLADDKGPRRPRAFKFENFWAALPGFQDVVSEAWNEQTVHTEPFHVVHHKMKITGDRLSTWSKGLFSRAKLLHHAALLVILRLDIAQESRQLSTMEADLRSRLKRRIIGFAVLERARKKQCARLCHLREGDANTKFFHRRVNARRRKNYIHRLKHNDGWVTDNEQKEQLEHAHFSSVMEKGEARSIDFNWEELDLETHNLACLGDPITEDEVRDAINQMPGDKAPGPDGFTAEFMRACWGTIRQDLLDVFQQLFQL